MFILLIIFLIIVLLIKFRKYKIKWSTFTKPGIRIKDSRFGVYCFHGKQGCGKTANVIRFIEDEVSDEWPLFANLKSLKGIKYTYFNGLQTLLSLRNLKHCIIFYDEIFTIIQKGTKFDNDLLDFLSQMRKREIIFVTTAQEWLELPISLRRYVRFSIKCSIHTLPLLPSFTKKDISDATNMTWDNLQNEYVAPLISSVIEKLQKRVLNSYDTFEQIPTNVETSPIYMYNDY